MVTTVLVVLTILALLESVLLRFENFSVRVDA